VHSSVCGPDVTLAQLREGGLEADVVARRRGPLGPLLTARVEMLESRGLLRGREEEMLVIRAVAPERQPDRQPARV
jgi:release factor glutamine methyltransferase